jgi:hypothetical protein
MSNIEIHGVDLSDQAKKATIVEILKHSLRPEIAAKVVITNAGSVVTDLNDQPQPFLRIIDSNPARARRMAMLFADWDVEISFPVTFFPRRITSETKK